MAKKLSVYLPDDLWERAERLGTATGEEKLNASGLVQRALELMLQERDARVASLGAGTIIDRERFDAVLAGVRAGARAEFERGYACGLEFVEIQGFDGLSWIAEDQGIQEALEIVLHDSPAHQEWWDKYSDEFDPHFKQHHAAFRAGADKAVMDVWNALRRDGWGADVDSAASSLPKDRSEH